MRDEFFEYQKEIGQRIFDYIKNNGYSKSSFAKLTNISRPTLDDMISGTIPSKTTYEKHMDKILQATGLSIDTFLQESTPERNESFARPEQSITFYSDRAPRHQAREYTTQKIFSQLEDVYHLCDLYLGEETDLPKEILQPNCQYKYMFVDEGPNESRESRFFTHRSRISREHLDEIVCSNRIIREELSEYMKVFSDSYRYSKQSPEKVAFEFLKRYNVLQVPVPDNDFGGAIRVLKNGRRLPVINTAQPRLYQYFVYWHELYHLLFDKQLDEQHHNISIEFETTERKADYFAALMLMKNEVYWYYCNLQEKDFYRKIALCMDSYKAPYKAILIQLYETAHEEHDFETMHVVKEYFDRKLSTSEWVQLFEQMGLDTAVLLPSETLSWGRLQQQIETEWQENPDISYHQHNLDFLKQVTAEIKPPKSPDVMIQVDDQVFIFECRTISAEQKKEIPIIPQRLVQKDEETWEVEFRIDK